MPHAHIDLVTPLPQERPSMRGALKDAAAEIIANELSCKDDNGRLQLLTGEKVTMFVRGPNPKQSASSPFDAVVTIVGIDYAHRMRTIDKRCADIARGIKALLPSDHNKVSVKFHPLKKHFWATA